MFKLVVLSALLAIAAARPGLYGHLDTPLVYAAPEVHSGYEYSATVHAPDYVNHVAVSSPLVGSTHIVKTYPEAISHDSHLIVHGKRFVAPLLAPLHSYHTPLLHEF